MDLTHWFQDIFICEVTGSTCDLELDIKQMKGYDMMHRSAG